MNGNELGRNKALVVDDVEINRMILKDILQEDMEVIEAANGKEAIDMIEAHNAEIAIVLLDQMMPEKNGIEVLEYMHSKHYTEDIPVIMISVDDDDANVAKAFDLGAIDYISRPFSARIFLRRVLTTVSLFHRKKAIAFEIDKRFESHEKTKDELTGLNLRNAFYNKVYDKVKNSQRRALCMVAIDIDHFKLFNRFYGRAKGDEYLKLVGRTLREYEDKYGATAGYLGGDDFAILCPNRQDILGEMKRRAREELLDRDYELGYAPKFGVFVIEDSTEPIMDIVDHAFTALASIKTDYTHLMAWYNQDMVRTVRDEFVLLSDVERALGNDEFTFYLQPKVNMVNGKVVGSEALVRWNHREKGLIPPAAFLPVLEKNGFVTKVSQIVWDKVCKWQKDWIDSGREPLPISVNVSKNDMFSLNFTEYFLNLMEKYQLPANMIELEITETTYIEDLERVGAEINKLHTAGFTILMDDFGSGYSSLNSLKELEIDVLKIDMKFLRIDYENQEKGKSILESMVNMANQLRLPIIVEGVEMRDQVKLLTEMGCKYAQGYYYHRPLNVAAYEELISDPNMIDHDGIQLSDVDQVHMMDFSEEKLFTDEMINNILGAVAFYEVKGDTVKLIRLNEQYYKMMDMAYVMSDSDYAVHLRQSIYPEDRDEFFNMFKRADENNIKGATADIRYMKDGVDLRWIRFRIYPLRKQNDAHLYYGSLEDITEIYQGGDTSGKRLTGTI